MNLANITMTRIYIQSPRWFVRPRNTDWVYTRFMIPRINEFAPSCLFYPACSQAATIEANCRYALSQLASKLKVPCRAKPLSYLDRGEFVRNECDVVFSHDDYPANAQNLPVVWQNSILDPEMVSHYRIPKERTAVAFESKREGFLNASAVHVSTDAERERLKKWFPESAHKFVSIPFFLPDAKTISPDAMTSKTEGPLRCLFVGNEARRKGLPRVYSAMELLPPSLQRQIHFTAVSQYADGEVATPHLPHLHTERAVPHHRVMELMRQSDVFIMPSLYESYGLTYLEAMSQGTIPIVPDWEVQREIVDYGRAGIVTTGEPAHIASILTQLVEDHTLRRRLAWAARQRFEERFAPSIVAEQFRELFSRFKRSATGLSNASE